MIPPDRLLAAALVLLAYVALCAAVGWDQWRRRRATARELATLDVARAPASTDDGSVEAPAQAAPVLVAYASQTGQAEALAWQAARALRDGGVPVRLRDVAQLSLRDLQDASRAVLIVSTCGEGDPPDAASGFVDGVMRLQPAPSLTGLRCGVLALGDRRYAQYCGFGRRLDDWLQRCGAQALFERVEVDAGDADALARWRTHLGALAGHVNIVDAVEDRFETWRLASRRLLNPGSLGGACVELELLPAEGALPDWQAGDLAQVQAPGDPRRPRDYSIASVPADGSLQLIVRRTRRDDGRPGIASGWLCDELPIGGGVPLRLRAHAGFRLGDNAGRPLILIGNGSGLAGLRAHLRALQAARREGGADGARTPAGGHWLVFGERQRAHDSLCADEVDGWLADGLLARADRVYSRDQPARRHVQHLLREQGEALRAAVHAGAAIYVCGSLQGMGREVDIALDQALGHERLQGLRREGRYRRDLY